MGATVLPGAGTGSYSWRLRQQHRLFTFMVFRRGAGVIFRNGFYFEL